MTVRLNNSATRATLVRASFALTLTLVAIVVLYGHGRSRTNPAPPAGRMDLRAETRQASALIAREREATQSSTAIRLVASGEEHPTNEQIAAQPFWVEEGCHAEARKQQQSPSARLVPQGQAVAPAGISVPANIETVSPQPKRLSAQAASFPSPPPALTESDHLLSVQYSEPETVASPEAGHPPAKVERAPQSEVDNPLCPLQQQIGFGRIDSPCDSQCSECMTVREKVEAFHASNHPKYYFERPFGSYVRSAVNAQISNGLADQMVLYHYDFQQGARSSELTSRGKYQLSKFIHRMLSCGFPIVIEETPADPTVADARRNAVMAELQKMDDSIGRLDDLVIVSRPRLPGLRGAEAQLIDDNNLLQTQSRGTIGPGEAIDYGSDNGGQSSVPTIP